MKNPTKQLLKEVQKELEKTRKTLNARTRKMNAYARIIDAMKISTALLYDNYLKGIEVSSWPSE